MTACRQLGRHRPESPRPDDVALFLHTSGTTSRPKGVPLTHANLMASIRNIAAHYRLTPGRRRPGGHAAVPRARPDRRHAVAPSGPAARVVLPPRFSATAFWPAVKAHRVTWYSAVPTIHQILLSRADADGAPRQSGFRFIRSCSSALAPATLAQLESRFGAPVLEAYAMTEASHQMTSNPLPPAGPQAGQRRPRHQCGRGHHGRGRQPAARRARPARWWSAAPT